VSDASGSSNAGTLINGPAWFSSTIPFVPCVVTGTGTATSDTTANLSGTVNPNGSAATDWFEFGATTNYGGIGGLFLTGGDTTFSTAVTGLPPATLCHYRLVAVNGA